MKKRILFIMGMVCVSAGGYAQFLPRPEPLRIGDTVPDIVFHHMLNYKDSTARLSDFRGKLVILDFWNTWCGSCIEAFPKMDTLQKQFQDNIQIILVNSGGPKYDGRARVEKTLRKLRARTGFYPALPVSILDTFLNAYFPHKSVPHEVWINHGKVVAITGPNAVAADNISMLLSGQDPDMEVKNELNFKKMKPVWQQGTPIQDSLYVYRSVFTRYIKNLGIHVGRRYNKQGLVTGAYTTNQPLTSFVRSAYYKELNSCSQRMVLNVHDPDRFNTDDKTNYYCYDLFIPPVKSDSFRYTDYLKLDLKRSFNISGRIENRVMKCWILYDTTKKIKHAYSKYNKQTGDLRRTTIKKYLHYWTVPAIVRTFASHLDRPLLNEVRMTRRIDIDFPDHFTWPDDPDKVLQVLKDLGFRIKQAKRKLNILVITD